MARPPSSSSPSTVAPVTTSRFGRCSAGRRKASAALQRRAALLGDLEHRDAVLLGAVVVVDPRDARRPRWRARSLRVERRAASAAPRPAARRRRRGTPTRPRALSSERRKYGRTSFQPQPGGALLDPEVVVERPAADVEHRVHRARAAQRLAARDEQRAPVDGGLGLGRVVPVELRVELVRERRRDLDVRDGGRAPPASISSTRTEGSSLSRLASTQPAEPAPTIT